MQTKALRRLALPLLTLLWLLMAGAATSQEESELTAEERAELESLRSILDSLDRQTGNIALGDGLATLRVPEDYYYLDPEDARVVLVDLWGNPPEVAAVLGMLFPDRYTPFDSDSWAVTIEYVDEGHVSDEDAAEIDYNELLESMQSDTRDSNDARIDAGYGAIELVGWAEQPHYDPSTKKLYWAKELRFDGNEDTTLNYDIRALGRTGVLSMTFIASSRQLSEINANRDEVLAMAEFNEGKRYQDFDSSIDKVAAYGIGALVAGKVAAKAGLLAGALLFLKKFGVFLLLGIAALGKRIIGSFRKD
jgi:uncharacterized membrane-anchored protein